MIVEHWREAVIKRIRADAHMADLLGKYQGVASVFGFEAVPETAGDPWLLVPGIDLSLPEADKTQMRYEITHTLEVWARNDQDPQRVGNAADYLCLMFHRSKPEISGATVHSVIAELPIELEADDFLGRGVTLTAVLHRGE